MSDPKPLLPASHRLALGLARTLPAVRGRQRLVSAFHERYRVKPMFDLSVRMCRGYVLSLPSTSRQTWVAALTGSYDDDVVSLLMEWARPNTVILDVGASCGLYTLQMAQIGRDEGIHVVAVEPNPRNCEIIQHNVKECQLDEEVTIVPTALGSVAGSTNMYFEHGGVGNGWVTEGVPESEVARHSLVGGIDAYRRVEIVPLDNLKLPSGSSECSVLKIDVEGFEADVLKGAEEFIDLHRPAIIGEFNRHWLMSRGVRADWPIVWAEGHGYRIYGIVGRRRRAWMEAEATVVSGAWRDRGELLMVPMESDRFAAK